LAHLYHRDKAIPLFPEREPRESVLSRRRLSKHQIERVQKRRQAGVEAQEAAPLDEFLGPEKEGLVLGYLGKQVDIEDTAGSGEVRCHMRANLGILAAGDRVLWCTQGEGGVVTAVFPRQSELHRPDAFGKLKLVAANVSRMVITLAPEPQAHANLIDRYLVVAETLGLEPLLLVNKQDLLPPDHPLFTLLADYQALGYETLRISARRDQGMDRLRSSLSTGVSVFVGQSGVGKSSIIQALLPDERIKIKIGDLSEQEQKGRHTTTHARLYHFPFGGDCIDSPGIREFGLWHLSPDQVAAGFREFRDAIDRCRFRDCSHTREPGCGLQAAVQASEIRTARYDSFRQILASLDAVVMQDSKLT
jgi:ribosome biogenesis GTPase